jgi:hypothetical protein
MKSGDFTISRDDGYYRGEFSNIADRAFTKRIFRNTPALVARDPVNGRRIWKEYDGLPYDQTKFELIEGMWDHGHCMVCYFSIRDGMTYWENAGRGDRLCDACYEALTNVRLA